VLPADRNVTADCADGFAEANEAEANEAEASIERVDKILNIETPYWFFVN